MKYYIYQIANISNLLKTSLFDKYLANKINKYLLVVILIQFLLLIKSVLLSIIDSSRLYRLPFYISDVFNPKFCFFLKYIPINDFLYLYIYNSHLLLLTCIFHLMSQVVDYF